MHARWGHEAMGAIVHRRRAGTSGTHLGIALLVASFTVVAPTGGLAGCDAYPGAVDTVCTGGNDPVCCAAVNTGGCVDGYTHSEGTNKCGGRVGGGNMRSTCCVPSTPSPTTTAQATAPSPASTTPTPTPTPTPAPADYSCGSDVCPNNGGRLWAKVLGQSGKIDLAKSVNVASDPDKIRFEIDALRELDSSGTVLGQGGNPKHSFNSFATQSFTFGAVEDSTYHGLDCVKVPFSATLGTNSRIGIDIFLFKQAGTLAIGGETFTVTNSTMKFNVELSQWNWCAGGCTNSNGQGAALELDLLVTSRQLAAEKAPGARLYDMGSDAVMRLSSRVQVDGSWQDLPDNGPAVTSGGGSKTKITLKFPFFNTTLLYDPDITYCQGSAAQCQVHTRSRALACRCIVSCESHYFPF